MSAFHFPLLNCFYNYKFCAKIFFFAVVTWVFFSLMRQNDYTFLLNDLYSPEQISKSLNAGDEEVLLDINQNIDLPLQQDFKFYLNEGIESNNFVPNCGLPEACSRNEFSIHLYTGQSAENYPKLCIDGKYVLDKGLNNCGRGINAVVIDNVTRSIIRVTNFDTYKHDSSALETMLLTLRPGDIIVLITFDEASKKLSHIARLILHEMGSGMVQNLNYRGSWYLITQKNIEGYSPFEGLNLGLNNEWAKSFEMRACIPLQIRGIQVQPDPVILENAKKAKFCEKFYEDYSSFCEGISENDQIFISQMLRPLPISNQLSKVPIVVLTSTDKSQNKNLPLTMQTLIGQPGIVQKNVVVFYDANCCSSVAGLADLFNFMSVNEMTDSDSIEEIIKTVELLFSEAKAFIIIDKNVVLSTDFLPFMGQLLPYVLNENSDIIGVSSWNDNGYEKVSSSPSIVYKANASNYVPRFGVMFKKNFTPKNSLWSFNDNLNCTDCYLLIPDMSRVMFLGFEINQFLPSDVKNFIINFLRQNRSINVENEVFIQKTEVFSSPKDYQNEVKNQLLSCAKIGNPKIDDDSRNCYTYYCKNKIECQMICSELGLINCRPQITIDNQEIVRFSIKPNKVVNLVFKKDISS